MRSQTGGEIVKNTGDGVMVVFRHSAVDAVTCSVRMHDGVEALDPQRPAAIRVGIAAGEVASESGDWFGTPVVEASRLESAASPDRPWSARSCSHWWAPAAATASNRSARSP